MAKFWCAGCGTTLHGFQIEVFHSIGRMCKLCRSGRVTPIPESKKDEKA